LKSSGRMFGDSSSQEINPGVLLDRKWPGHVQR
jgi:hypothetical protein